jgi:hypothetical protein
MSHVVDPRIDAYIDRLPEWQQAICREVRALVHAADPEVTETIKRGVPSYFVLDGIASGSSCSCSCSAGRAGGRERRPARCGAMQLSPDHPASRARSRPSRMRSSPNSNSPMRSVLGARS